VRNVSFINPGLLCLILIAPPMTGLAYETDQFSNRLVPIEDSTELLDQQVNKTIEEIAGNWKGERNDWKFVTAIYHSLGGHHWVDKIERWAMKSPDVERLQTSRRESIYQGHPIWATRVAAIFGVGPTIRVNHQLIGSDKLGHFFSQGRKFYRRYLQSLDEARAAEHSAYTERAIFGQMTTGVYSNADLVANFEGYLFYRSLFDDEIVNGKPAILAWEKEQWVVQRSFTWADHVNEYWDEALNVNHFDKLLYPHLKERLETFCPDYFESPELFLIENEEQLKSKYSHLQLRDTSELRLEQLCMIAPEIDVKGVAGGSN
jgi:hypothetical protein